MHRFANHSSLCYLPGAAPGYLRFTTISDVNGNFRLRTSAICKRHIKAWRNVKRYSGCKRKRLETATISNSILDWDINAINEKYQNHHDHKSAAVSARQ